MYFTSKIKFIASAGLALAILLPGTAFASSTNPGKVIAGWVEKVTLPEITGGIFKAKLDTGAKTSSLHALNVRQFKKDGKKWVSFDFETEKGKLTHLERPRVRGVKIKEQNGGFDRRSVIEMDICFDGRIHRTEFTLSNRENLIYPVLLGRDFLAGIAVIDPDVTFLTQASCSTGATPGGHANKPS